MQENFHASSPPVFPPINRSTTLPAFTPQLYKLFPWLDSLASPKTSPTKDISWIFKSRLRPPKLNPKQACCGTIPLSTIKEKKRKTHAHGNSLFYF